MHRFLKKLKNFFNKRKKFSGRKRQIVGSIVLSGSLAFGSLKTGSGKIQNYETTPISTSERVIKTSNEALNLEDEQQVILAGINDKPSSPGPSNFPVAPPRGQGYRKPVSGGNPGGGDGGGGKAEFDDSCPAPEVKTNSGQEVFQDPNLYKSPKTKKRKVVFKIKDSKALVREAERMGKDQDVQRDANRLVEQLSLGNRNPGRGSKKLFKNISYLRSRKGARVFYREIDGTIEILAKASKDNESKVIKILKDIYNK